jgi:glycosyltransferase involved in cell wall biosynthesis
MLSFIIPAYNEELLLGGTLRAIRVAAGAIGEPFEVVVADDASTDRTADVARELGAHVVAVHHRQIGATRNAGARATRGEFLVFVDAPAARDAGRLAYACFNRPWSRSRNGGMPASMGTRWYGEKSSRLGGSDWCGMAKALTGESYSRAMRSRKASSAAR